MINTRQVEGSDMDDWQDGRVVIFFALPPEVTNFNGPEDSLLDREPN